MRKKLNIRKHQNKMGAGKVLTGMLLGSVFGAAVALLMAPASGEELRRRITGEASNIREKINTSRGNVESRARELMQDVNRTGTGASYSA
jgi:gas vesicle protein